MSRVTDALARLWGIVWGIVTTVTEWVLSLLWEGIF